MTLGEVKIEALKIMFVDFYDNVGVQIDTSDISRLETVENYAPYLLNMNGTINRCFADIERKRVLPLKSYVVLPSLLREESGKIVFDLSNIPDLFELDRVILKGNAFYEPNVDFEIEGTDIILPKTDGTIKIIYRPTIKRITELTANTVDLTTDEDYNIPEGIVALIPNFIKGDLYRDEEPNEASESRNWYEAGIAAYMRDVVQYQSKVKTVYHI